MNSFGEDQQCLQLAVLSATRGGRGGESEGRGEWRGRGKGGGESGGRRRRGKGEEGEGREKESLTEFEYTVSNPSYSRQTTQVITLCHRTQWALLFINSIEPHRTASSQAKATINKLVVHQGFMTGV